MENNYLKDHEAKEEGVFDDPRLNKLWNKVCMWTKERGNEIFKDILEMLLRFYVFLFSFFGISFEQFWLPVALVDERAQT